LTVGGVKWEPHTLPALPQEKVLLAPIEKEVGWAKGIKPRFLGCQARGLVAILTKLSQLKQRERERE
jgi:hypothetical protein